MNTFKSFETLLPTANAVSFDDIALDLFQFQYKYNPLYSQYVQSLGIAPASVQSVIQIPFLPISFFKSHLIKTKNWRPEFFFTSSGTTSVRTSQHAIYSKEEYCRTATHIFESFFGSLKNYHILALLPSYIERENSSLVTMIDHFIKQTDSPHSDFYLHNQHQLLSDVENLKTDNRKVIVWGVTFALMDIAEKYAPDWSHCMVFETGGMKGRRKEITRQELHETLKKKLSVDKIYSEYGMTELLSQAYTRGDDLFYPAYTMKVIIRDTTDPFQKGILNKTGGINVIDLANLHSVAFIETEDLGKVASNGAFEVLGRFDNSDIRGCTLLVE